MKELVKKTKSSDKFDTKADRDDDEGEVYEQFLKNKRRNETSLMKNKSFVKKKDLVFFIFKIELNILEISKMI